MPGLPLAKPLVRQTDGRLQLSYQLPHRVYSAKAYPTLSPNGSSIIIYGYENGLKVIWRGGKHFKPIQDASSTEQDKKTDGPAKDDAVMIIDSDEEETPEPPRDESSKVAFEETEAEIDPSRPFKEILRHVDIPLGSAVLSLAVPRCLPEGARSPLDPLPPVLSKRIVVAATCADMSTRIITLPLVPPHVSNADPSTWGLQILSISGLSSHQEIPRGVALTFTCQEDGESQSDGSASNPRTSSRRESESGSGGRWDLLLATHSAEASGTLLVYRIPVIEQSNQTEKDYLLSESHLHPVQRRYLPAPARSISFNPSPYPSQRHANLLISLDNGSVKIYSYLAASSTSPGGRRGSHDDLDFTDPEGRWLMTLYPGFEPSSTGFTSRKTILDAQWVLRGRAVMVLLANGEWGVWDIEGAGPGSQQGPLRYQSSVQGVTGGSLTLFAVSGRVVATPEGNKSPASHSVSEQRSKFAPMTPSTKRLREDTLFKGSSSPSQPSLYGGISVIQTSPSRDTAPDESILIQHGNNSAIIPNLLALWRNHVKTTGTFDSLERCKMTPVSGVNLLGEKLNSVDHLPTSHSARETGRREFDILMAAEHQIIIVAQELKEPNGKLEPKHSHADSRSSIEADRLMLDKGELGVEGMDRILTGMANRGSPLKRARLFT
ncbi:hypothetical protein DTO166G4_686 [Paecilomyces variotii]|nr:hypothetical protein DTO032I3_8675 [Paecilomyces variotii]KAJ9205011.1 hypothetical protein DTO164E3_1634 [Paecilomyces variotii]KAJ9217504.1 hypothetical protein DTO166G4_686 [Paecilomyces variotii]KAJ9243016.1 hypothetical protein DTO166G5_120 [Paecilomyces variotii]KAJ9274726.1 hypothetical protein DTO021D3_8386 [Paecilomyces variotii]